MERKIKLILKDILLYKNHTNILIVGDYNVLETILTDIIKNTDGVLSYRLCGAGNGGHMLVISKNEIKFDVFNIKINIDNRGMKSWTL